MTTAYHIFGGPGSPYSHKVRAVFRYRRIPHYWTIPQGEFSGGGALGSDTGDEGSHLQRAAKGVVPVVLFPDGTYHADSTPLIYELEKRHEGRSVIPPHPAMAFLSHLIEDCADEFLPLPMFYYRWTDDQVWCGRRQMAGWMGAIDDEALDASAQAFLERQAGQLTNARALDPENMAKAYNQFLTAMEGQLKKRLYLFGTRPSLAEFGIYGQLTQYAVDPKVCNWMKEEAVRTYQWVHLVDDLSGVEGEWSVPEDCLTPELAAHLQFASETYIPMVQMLTQMVDLDNLGDAANGMPYRVRCFLQLKAELAALSDGDRSLIQPILEETGCWDALQFGPNEADKTTPIEMV